MFSASDRGGLQNFSWNKNYFKSTNYKNLIQPTLEVTDCNQKKQMATDSLAVLLRFSTLFKKYGWIKKKLTLD